MKRGKAFLMVSFYSLLLSSLIFSTAVLAGGLMLRPALGTPLVMTEVMFNPMVTQGEFIEIYNTSYSESVSLRGLLIKYQTSAADSLLSITGQWLLPPRSYAVAFEADYDFASGAYDLPSSALIFSIDDNAFGSSGMSNSSDRSLFILDSGGDTLDTYTYSADNSPGYSDEIICNDCNGGRPNWGNSAILNGTPGSKNSITPKDMDISVAGIYSGTDIHDNSYCIETAIKNTGRLRSAQYHLRVGITEITDTLAERIIRDTFEEALEAGDSARFSLPCITLPPGKAVISVSAQMQGDEDTLNNCMKKEIIVPAENCRYNDIVINEVMYAPVQDAPEWIELFNTSDRPIDMLGWSICDNSDTVLIASAGISIPAGGYLLISRSASVEGLAAGCPVALCSLPVLNNSGDAAVLYDPSGRCIDSLLYSAQWAEHSAAGISLERINPYMPSVDPQNWKASVSPSGSTPGVKNSVFILVMPAQPSLSISPEVFSPDGDGYEDNAVISYRLTETVSRLNIRIYDSQGRMVRHLANNSSSGAEGFLIFDGRNDEGRPLRIGIYIMLFEALGGSTGRLYTEKKAFVIARRL